MKFLILISCLMVSLFGIDNTIQLQFNDKDIMLDYKIDITDSKTPNDNLNFGITYLNLSHDDNPSLYIDKYLNIYFEMEEKFKNNFEVGIGYKVLYSTSSNGKDDFYGLPIYLNLNYNLKNKVLPIKIKTQFVYGPKVLTFSEGESYFETNIGISFDVIKNASVILNYKYIDMEYVDYNLRVDNNYYIGLEFRF